MHCYVAGGDAMRTSTRSRMGKFEEEVEVERFVVTWRRAAKTFFCSNAKISDFKVQDLVHLKHG